jgi:uncharacterized protein YfaS (alpha-2-macroglobulin family)
MRGWLNRVAVLLLVAGSAAAFGDTPATVLTATPGTDGDAIARFTLRFSEPMVPLAGGKDPIAMACAVDGKGRWVDPATYVWDYARPLPGGITCRATLKPDLETLAGHAVTGTRSFAIDTGGPVARAILPGEGDDGIAEDQVFLVAANGAVDRASVAASAYCAVDGIGERIAVDLQPAGLPARLLPALGNNWRTRSFLESAGVPSPLPAAAAARAKALANVVAFKCRRPLPPGRDMAVVWGADIRSPGGRAAGVERRFDFSVRREFSAKVTCPRVNPRAGCNPLEPLTVQFTAPVPRDQALKVRLDLPGNKQLVATAEGKDPTVSEVTFKPWLPVATTVKVAMPAGLRDESGRPLANQRRFPLDIAIAEAPPIVKFAAPFGILEASEGGVLPVTMRGVEAGLGMAVNGIASGTARIDGDDRAIADWLRRVDKAQDNDFREEGPEDHKVTVNHTGETPLLGAEAKATRSRLALPAGGRAFEVVGIPLKQPGFYVVELASPVLGRVLLGRPATRYVAAAALVTDMAVHFKWGRAASLAWVTSLGSGQPVAGATVRITDSCTGEQLATGTTDASGRFLVRTGLPAPSTTRGCQTYGDDSPPLMVSARKGGDFSFAMTSWGEGIQPYDFDLPYGWSAPDAILHTVFDRTLLRAGETLNMKHIYRMPTASGFRSAGAQRGTLILQHQGSDTSFELPLTLGPDGIGETRWTPPKGAPMGDYALTFRFGEKTVYPGQSVRVDEYRLPTMRATVSGPKEPAVKPKRLPLDLYVGYLSGGGAARAPVRLRTAYAALDDSPAGWEGWTFGGTAVREGTVPLDEDRSDGDQPQYPAAATVPLTLDPHGALRTALDLPALPDSARMTVEMDYQDANGETLTASTAIPVYSAGIRLGIKPDGWMQRSGDLRLKLAALTPDGKPAAGRRISVALYTREILSARRRLIGGFYAFDNNARTTRIDATCSARTDKQGLAECSLDPEVSGEVIAVATAKDDDGNEARAVSSVWLAGADDWWFGGDNGDRMDIVPDAKAYKAGDTAHVQVRMPFRNATALVTVEREGVLSSFVTTLSGKDPVVDVPMAGAYAPDAFISVVAVRGRIAGWRLWLADFARRWHLPFFNREGAYPTALVDLAKPSYRIGIAKVKVGWEAHRLQVRLASDRRRYGVRDRAQVAVQVRGPDGKPPRDAEIAFAAVDEALLQLSPNPSWDVLDAMMGERPLSVLNATGQSQVVGKRHYGRKAVASGGGGGGDLSALTRADFRPVLLWRGRVKLDAAGRARLTVPLADALSSYRLVAVATAGGDLFGTGSIPIRTAQDLTIYPGVPPLARAGDFYGATFTLRNGSDRPLRVTATVGVAPAVAKGAPMTVTIPAGGAVPVTWRLTAPANLSALRWTVAARSADGRAADRVHVDQKLIPAVPEEIWAATFLRVGEGTRVPVARPAGALPGRGGIDIALAASPAPPLDGVRAYMRAYPFGCFEQRLSKAIALDDRAGWDAILADLPTYVAGNGLLRYWPEERQPGSIALTAYALSITADAGLTWPDMVRGQMLAAMQGVVDGRITEEGSAPADARLLRLAALAALARNGAATPAMLGQVAVPLADMPTATLADWLVTLDRTPGADPAQRAAAEAALRGRIVYEGTRLDLVDKTLAPWWMMVSGDEMALKALSAAIGRPGWDQDAPRMMVGVALRQRRGHWDTTPANAWGTVIARRFATAYPAAVTAGRFTAGLGAASVGRNWPQAAGAAPLHLPLPARPTPLLLAHSAQPGPWATVSVRAAVPLTAPRFAGYKVERQVTFVERRRPDRLSRGDVLKVRIAIDSAVDRTWVVVEDPIPAGASIVGGMGGQSALLAAAADGGEGVGPSYVERGLDAWRGYFGWLPKGRTTVEYVVRVNGAGRFQLPPTRVEAMYSPEIHAAVPNSTLVVAP